MRFILIILVAVLITVAIIDLNVRHSQAITFATIEYAYDSSHNVCIWTATCSNGVSIAVLPGNLVANPTAPPTLDFPNFSR